MAMKSDHRDTVVVGREPDMTERLFVFIAFPPRVVAVMRNRSANETWTPLSRGGGISVRWIHA